FWKSSVVSAGLPGSTKSLTNARVAVYTAGIEPSSTETKGTVVIESAKELMGYNEGEEKMLHEVRNRNGLSLLPAVHQHFARPSRVSRMPVSPVSLPVVASVIWQSISW